MFSLGKRQTATLSTMTRMNTLIPSNHQFSNSAIAKQADTRPFSRIISPNQTIIYHSRSAYGQQLWSATMEDPETMQERFHIHKCMRQGQRATFAQLFHEQRKELRINDLMANLFMQGPCFNTNLFNSYLVRDRDVTGKTALHYAVCGGSQLDRPSCENRLVRPLLQAQDENGVTALMLAAERGDIDQVRLLLYEAGMQDRRGRTALMYALTARKAGAARLLWAPEVALADFEGVSARDYVARYRMEDPLARVANYQQHRQASARAAAQLRGADDEFIEGSGR